MNLFLTNNFNPNVATQLLEDEFHLIDENTIIHTTDRNKDKLFIDFAIERGLDFKVYTVDSYTTENCIETISHKVDYLVMFTNQMVNHFNLLFKTCNSQVIMSDGKRMPIKDFKSLTVSMHEDNLRRTLKKHPLVDTHEMYEREVKDVYRNVNRVKIKIIELEGLS